jgi:hypothetical protein
MRHIRLILQAYIFLLFHDMFMWRNDFAALHKRVKAFSIRNESSDPQVTEVVSAALDIACCFYPRQALCLQRSSVLVEMLRRHGVRAHLVIGAQKMPFKAHAWVEVDGSVINDRLASREEFLVLEVC